MLRRHDVANDGKCIPFPRLFERALEGCPCAGSSQFPLPPVATEGDEVKAAGFLESFQSGGHDGEFKARQEFLSKGGMDLCFPP